MRVELSSLVTWDKVDLGEVTIGHHLDIQGCLDKVHGRDGAVGDDSGIVAGLCAVGDGLGLDVTNDLLCCWTECAPVVDRVDRCETSLRS